MRAQVKVTVEEFILSIGKCPSTQCRKDGPYGNPFFEIDDMTEKSLQKLSTSV